MRLLNTLSSKIETFLGGDIPQYVILSHTRDKEEVTFQDMLSGVATSKQGYLKITNCCKQAVKDGFKYCWIDTCCIDKTSSAELSEAINSMYQWYKDSVICYVYLADYKGTSITTTLDGTRFTKCRWFKRGWTLQELIAPNVVEFYNQRWEEFGTRSSLQQRLHEDTGIDKVVLSGGNPSACVVAERMSWAAGRQTTRVEDQAYCLLGLFGVNMPLLYGEGVKAFKRLQIEIMRGTEDYTLFAWSGSPLPRPSGTLGLFAASSSDFEHYNPLGTESHGLDVDNLRPFERSHLWTNYFGMLRAEDCDIDPPELNSRGLKITLPLYEVDEPREDDRKHWIVCPSRSRYGPIYVRHHQKGLFVLPYSLKNSFNLRSLYVFDPPPENVKTSSQLAFRWAVCPASLSLKLPEEMTSRLIRIVVPQEGMISKYHVVQSGVRIGEPDANLTNLYQESRRCVDRFCDDLGRVSGRGNVTRYDFSLASIDESDAELRLSWYVLPGTETSMGFKFRGHADKALLIRLKLGPRPACEIQVVSMGLLEILDTDDDWHTLSWLGLTRSDRSTVKLSSHGPNGKTLDYASISASIRHGDKALSRSEFEGPRFVLILKEEPITDPRY